MSHHIHCNDDALDEDVFSAFPFLRFDPRLPRAWYHQYQWLYMWVLFPFLQFIFQVGAGVGVSWTGWDGVVVRGTGGNWQHLAVTGSSSSTATCGWVPMRHCPTPNNDACKPVQL